MKLKLILLNLLISTIKTQKNGTLYVPSEFLGQSTGIFLKCSLLPSIIILSLNYADYANSIGKSSTSLITDRFINTSIETHNLIIIGSPITVSFSNVTRSITADFFFIRRVNLPLNNVWSFKIEPNDNFLVGTGSKLDLTWVLSDNTNDYISKYALVLKNNTLSITNSSMSSKVALDNSCYEFVISIPCYYVFKNSMVKIKYTDVDAGMIQKFEMFNQIANDCSIKYNNVEGTYTCTHSATELVISGLFPIDQKINNITINICNLVNPPYYKKQGINIELATIEDDTYADSYVLIESETPMIVSTKILNGNEQYIEKAFEIVVEITSINSLIYSDTMKIEIDLPAEFIGVENVSFKLYNSTTKQRLTEANISESSSKRFIVYFKSQSLNFKTGFILTIYNFYVPGSIGKQKIAARLIDVTTNLPIAQPFNIEFNVMPGLIHDFDFDISSYDIGTTVSGTFKLLIPSIDSPGVFNLLLDLGKGLYPINDNSDNFSLVSVINYESTKIDFQANTFIITNVGLNIGNLPTYVHFKLKNLKTSGTEAFNLAVGINVTNGSDIIWEKTTNYDLSYIQLSIKDQLLQINQKAFLLDINFSYNNSVLFDHYLRFNLPLSFQINFDQPCVTNSDLPAYSSLGLCTKGMNNYNDRVFNRTSLLIKNALKNSMVISTYTISIQGTLDAYVQYEENITVDIIGVSNNEPLNEGSSTVSEPINIRIMFDCPISCQNCDTNTQLRMICKGCLNNLLVDTKSNTCVKELPKNDNSNDISTPNEDEENNEKLQYFVEKIFIGFYFNFIIVMIVTTLYLKTIFGNKIFISEYLSVLSSAAQAVLNYLILASSWDTNNSKLKVSLINIVIILFWLANLITSFYIIHRNQNKIYNNTRIASIKSNSLFLFAVYVIFGSGCSLWISTFKMSDIYTKVLLPEDQVKALKNLSACVIYTNMLLVLVLTVSVASVLFLFDNESNFVTILYLFNGVITFGLYMLIIYFRKNESVNKITGFAVENKKNRISNFEFSFVRPIQRIRPLYAESAQSLADDTSIELMKLKDEDLHPDLRRWMHNIEMFKEDVL